MRRDRMANRHLPGNCSSRRDPLGYPSLKCGKACEKEGCMPLKMRVRDREPIGLALRRFKKLLERSGIQKELRKRKYYEKPCEARRRAELRKQSSIRKARTMLTRKP